MVNSATNQGPATPNDAEFVIYSGKKPQFYNDPKIKSRIIFGTKVFHKEGRQDVLRSGYSKLLNKILESNLTLRQIKNGQTLFEKEMMQKKYNNPFLENDELKEELRLYIQ